MKKLFLSLLAILALSKIAGAVSTPDEWNYIPYSSYTDVATTGNMMFSSAPIQFVGITVSSPALGSFLAIYRSTTPVWTPDISTQAFISTDYVGLNGGPQFIDLFDMKNTSYTHINKSGNAKIIIWIHCPKPNLKSNEIYAGFCPGLPFSGQLGAPMIRISP